MFLTGIRSDEDRESRTRDYYNSLKKRIQLNTGYEESVNNSKMMSEKGISKPPPPETNIDKELMDINLQKQKAFNSVKEILKKYDQATKFISKLEDGEIIPFNRYLSKFKSNIKGIAVEDADFLLNLWDSFKKKILLTDKEVPILGTELETYKVELQKKADDIVDYAAKLGLDEARIRNVLDAMVNESDSSSIDKFYFNLLTKGPQAANLVLKEDFKTEGPIPILTEEVLPENIITDYDEKMDKIFTERERLVSPLFALVYRDRPYTQMIKKGVRSVDERTLDIKKAADRNIIAGHIPLYINRIMELTKQINEFKKLLGEDPIPSNQIISELVFDENIKALLPELIIPGEKIDEKELETYETELPPVPIKKGSFDFSFVDENDFKNLIELYEASKEQVASFIMSLHPDGKFTFNGTKYNMMRNPPTTDKQKEYLLDTFNKTYNTKIPMKELFEELVKSPEYKRLKDEEAATLESLVGEEEMKRAAIEAAKATEEKELSVAEEKKFVSDMQKEAKAITDEFFTQIQLFMNNTVYPFIEGVRRTLIKIAAESGLETNVTTEEVIEALSGSNNPFQIFNLSINDQIISLMRIIINKFEPEIDRYESAAASVEALSNKIDILVNKFENANKKNAKKIAEDISKLEADVGTKEDFMNRNRDSYMRITDGIEIFQTRLGEISGYIQNNRTKYEVELNNLGERLVRENAQLVSRYDTLGNKLATFGILLPQMADSIEKMLKDMPRQKITKREKLMVNVPKRVPKKISVRLADRAPNKAARRAAEEAAEEARLREYTGEEKEGAGVHEKRPLRKKLKSTAFGKYDISMKALGSGVLDIRTACNRTSAKLPRTPVSSRLEKMIKYVIKNNDIDLDLFENLTDDEKKLFIYAIDISDVELNSMPFEAFKKFKASDLQKELDELIDRYHLLTGQLGAGNNAPEILRELKGIIFKLLEKKKIDRVYANELLLMINTVN